MKKLIAELPLPVGRYVSPTVCVDVYRAKDLLTRRWNDKTLKKIVLMARNSYSRYGDRPLLDSYDPKSAIYLARATYRSKGVNGDIHEWLSIRMVPGNGMPQGVGEPEIYERKGKPMDYWIRRKLKSGGAWKHIASSSRMCGLSLYAIKRNGDITDLEGVSHKYTSVCFAIIHKQFLVDYPLEQFSYRYITAIIRPDFYKKGLGYHSRKQIFYPFFTPAFSFLGFPRGEVRVKRAIYSYKFPSYWLDAKKLLRLINRMRAENNMRPIAAISPGTLDPLAGGGHKKVLVAGMVVDSLMMRKAIDRSIPDVPELKITPAAVWYKSMDRIIAAAHLKNE
jgi:hypothetical protein